jgi:hypothetical protein
MGIYERFGHMKRRIRVVFDDSRLTRERHCLNEFLLTGPPLQGDLSLILANWRQYKFEFMADIIKMFRQIRVDFQRILWSPDFDIPPIEYRLKTVTYITVHHALLS